jgi:hypothetical protein
MTRADDHCLRDKCKRQEGDDSVCECDCVICVSGRRSPEIVLADAYRQINEDYQDFGDVGSILIELAESLAAILRAKKEITREVSS